MDIKHVKSTKLDDFTLISSLPDMGRVGGLVSQHIAKKLGTDIVTRITISDKPWIDQSDGIITIPCDEYRLSVDQKNRIVVFEGSTQPQEPPAVIELTNAVFAEAQKIGRISKIITAGGYMPVQQGRGDRVFGVATTQQALDEMQSRQIAPLASDVASITWFNGLILGKAKEAGIDGIGLFGEIADANTPQYETASRITQKIQQIVGVSIGTSELDEKIAGPVVETKTENPGIG